MESGKGYNYISDSVAQEASANGGKWAKKGKTRWGKSVLFLERLADSGNMYLYTMRSVRACILK